MKREDLFAAIGEVEESRLARCELAVKRSSGADSMEESNMKNKHLDTGRIIRNVLIAAVIVSTLAVTAFAATGFLIFDSPSQMLESLFGDKTGYDHKEVTHWTDPEKPGSVYDIPAYDRVPVDEDVMQSEAASLVSPVGQSINWQGYTLTVDANMYDKVTKCGVLTYTIENPDGLAHYEVQPNGEIWFPDGELLNVNQYGYSYIIQDQSSDIKLTAAYFYQLRNPDNTDFELTISEWAAKNLPEYQQQQAEIEARIRQTYSEEDAIAFKKEELGGDWAWYEANFSREEIIESGYWDLLWYKSEEMRALDETCICPDKITIPEAALGKMRNITLADGKITVSPIALCVDVTDMQDYPSGYISVTKIRFQDGTEYVVKDDSTANYVFAVGATDKDVTFMFNRMIDVNEITSVILDGGLEFPVR